MLKLHKKLLYAGGPEVCAVLQDKEAYPIWLFSIAPARLSCFTFMNYLLGSSTKFHQSNIHLFDGLLQVVLILSVPTKQHRYNLFLSHI